jgi:hypothetical protein
VDGLLLLGADLLLMERIKEALHHHMLLDQFLVHHVQLIIRVLILLVQGAKAGIRAVRDASWSGGGKECPSSRTRDSSSTCCVVVDCHIQGE